MSGSFQNSGNIQDPEDDVKHNDPPHEMRDSFSDRCLAFFYSPWAHLLNFFILVLAVIYLEHRIESMQGNVETMEENSFKFIENLGVVNQQFHDIQAKYAGLLDTNLISQFNNLELQAKRLTDSLQRAEDMPQRLQLLEQLYAQIALDQGEILMKVTQPVDVPLNGGVPFVRVLDSAPLGWYGRIVSGDPKGVITLHSDTLPLVFHLNAVVRWGASGTSDVNSARAVHIMWRRLDTDNFPDQQKGVVTSYGWDTAHATSSASREPLNAVLKLWLPSHSYARVQLVVTKLDGGDSVRLGDADPQMTSFAEIRTMFSG